MEKDVTDDKLQANEVVHGHVACQQVPAGPLRFQGDVAFPFQGVQSLDLRPTTSRSGPGFLL